MAARLDVGRHGLGQDLDAVLGADRIALVLCRAQPLPGAQRVVVTQRLESPSI